MSKITIDLEAYGNDVSIGYDMSNGVDERVAALVKCVDDNTQLIAFCNLITGKPLEPWKERVLIAARRLGIRDNFKLVNYNMADVRAAEYFKAKAIETGTSIHEAILTADHYPTGFIQLPQAGSQIASAFSTVYYGLMRTSELTEFQGGFRKSLVCKSVLNVFGVTE